MNGRSMNHVEQRHDFAVALAIEAGELARSMRATLAAATAKSPVDFCTEADLAVERLVRARIAARFADAVIGEEHGGDPAESVWVVDPIDGTTEYIHATARWCVSIAYVREGRVQCGVIHSPPTSRLFAARRGAGATLNGAPIRVSRLAHKAVPVIEVGWSDRRPVTAYASLIVRLNALGYEFRRHGSGALALAEVAAGLNDGYVEQHMNPWDSLAGALLVEEAGGRCNDLLANDGLRNGSPVIAATPELWDPLMAAALA